MDQVLIGTSAGLFFVDANSGNISNQQLNEIIGGGPRCIVPLVDKVVCAPQVSKGLVHYWRTDSSSGNPVYKCSSPEVLTCVVFSSCGGLMFAGTPSGTIYIWQTWTGNLLRSWTAHFGAVSCIRLSQDDSFFFTAGDDASIKGYFLPDVFDEESKSPVPSPSMVFGGHSAKINDIQISVDGKILASCANDKSVKLFDVDKKCQQSTLVVSSEPTRIALSFESVFIGCVDGSVWSSSLHSTTPACFSATHKSSVSGMAITVDGSRLVTCAESDGMKIWDTSAKVLIQSVIGPQQQLKSASCLVMLPAQPVIPESIKTDRYCEPYRLVSAINAYLVFKPLQRTLTPIETIEKIPLITVPLFGSENKVKSNHAFSVDEKSNQLVLSGTTHAGVISQLENQLEEQRKLTKSLSASLIDLYGRVQGLRKEGDPVVDLFFPNMSAKTATPSSAKKRSRR
jgi:WD40 repeat protein